MTKSKNALIAISLLISIIPTFVSAATISSEICVSMTVLSQSSPNVISGGGNLCANVSGDAVATTPGDSVVFSDFFEDIGILGGGTNTTGNSIDYTVQFDWTYSILTEILNSNETASGLVRADIFGLEFTSGSGSGSQIISSTLENNMAVDYFITVYAEANATSIAPVPLPASIWLFGTGILGLFGAIKRKANK